MRNLHYFAAIALVSMSLSAEQTGRIAGKVLDAAGKPVPHASIAMKRLDIAFFKEIKVDAKGNYRQAGLEPKEYEMTVLAEGYVGIKEIVRVPLGVVLTKDFTLLTADQRLAPSGGEGAAGASKAEAGNTAYTEAVRLYNDKDYLGAMRQFSQAVGQYSESIAGAADRVVAEEAKEFLAKAVDLLADCQFEVGKGDPGQRGDLWSKAEPVLKKAFDVMPADDKSRERARLAYQLGEMAKTNGDMALEKKYNDALDKIEGPKVENSYNTAVALYNADKLSEAKPHLKKAIEINPSFAETYYLLAICEYADGDMRAAKANLQKYIELAPKGKYAAEVKEMLAEPEFKSLK